LCIEKPPSGEWDNYNPEPLSKVCALVQRETDQENSADEKRWWIKAPDMRRKREQNGMSLSKYDRLVRYEGR